MGDLDGAYGWDRHLERIPCRTHPAVSRAPHFRGYLCTVCHHPVLLDLNWQNIEMLKQWRGHLDG